MTPLGSGTTRAQKSEGYRALRRKLERRRLVHFWGRRYFVTPRVVERVIGDGKQLLWFEPLNTRPNYYVVRVDGSWDVSAGDVCDHYEEICDAIEDSFGNHAWPLENNPRRKHGDPWPALDDETGASWGVLTLRPTRPAHRRRR